MPVGTFTCSTVRDTRAATLSRYLLQCILPSTPQVVLFYNTILRSSKLLPHLQQLIRNLGSFQNQNITQEPKSFTSPALSRLLSRATRASLPSLINMKHTSLFPTNSHVSLVAPHFTSFHHHTWDISFSLFLLHVRLQKEKMEKRSLIFH